MRVTMKSGHLELYFVWGTGIAGAALLVYRVATGASASLLLGAGVLLLLCAAFGLAVRYLVDTVRQLQAMVRQLQAHDEELTAREDALGAVMVMVAEKLGVPPDDPVIEAMFPSPAAKHGEG